MLPVFIEHDEGTIKLSGVFCTANEADVGI